MPSSPSSIKEQSARLNFFQRLLDNPIIAKELKSRMRGKQGATLITVYLVLIAIFIIIVYLILKSDGSISNGDPGFLQKMGKTLFGVVVLSELLMIGFIGPALTSGAIASERERQTFDLLRVSLLSPRDLLVGKLGSSVMYLLLLILTAIPLQSLAFIIGGVGAAEVIISIVILVVSAFLFCALGLYFSAIAKRVLTATILSYAAILLPVIIVAALFFWISSTSGPPSDVPEIQRMWIIIILTALSTNPLTAAFLTELLLTEEHTLLIMPIPDPYVVLPSAWIIYVLYAVTLTVLMIWLSAFYLKRYEY